MIRSWIRSPNEGSCGSQHTKPTHFFDNTTMADLEKLKVEISEAGETVKALKSAGEVDKDAVGKAVADLLALKKKYADANNGIGVDGKPYEEPLTKAQKKAKEKAEKNAKKAETEEKQQVWLWKQACVSMSESCRLLCRTEHPP